MESVVTATDNYLSLILSIPNLSPIDVLSAFILVMARILPIMVLAPFFASKSAPNPMKIAFGISIAAIVLPQTLFSLKEPIVMDFLFAIYLLKETFIGFVLGFFITIPFYVAQSSGSLIDHIRGSSSLQVTDPSTKTQTSPIGIFYNYTLIVIFFIIGGPFLFIEALASSFQLVPINKFFSAAFFSAKVPLWALTIDLLNRILKIAIQLGAPSIIGILMAEMFLGIANRLAPKVQIVFLGISLKSWVGLSLLAVAWYFVMQQLGKESMYWIKTIQDIVGQIKVLK